ALGTPGRRQTWSLATLQRPSAPFVTTQTFRLLTIQVPSPVSRLRHVIKRDHPRTHPMKRHLGERSRTRDSLQSGLQDCSITSISCFPKHAIKGCSTRYSSHCASIWDEGR